jgi:methanogenic corrinoid protein MtbC1
VTFLGADTPIPMVARTARAVDADVVVVAATTPHVLPATASELRSLGIDHRVVLAGPAASDPVARSIGARCTTSDPGRAAIEIAALISADGTGDTST